MHENADARATATLEKEKFDVMGAGGQVHRHHRVTATAQTGCTDFNTIDPQAKAVITIANEPAETGFFDENLAAAANGKIFPRAKTSAAIGRIPKRKRL